MYILLLTSILTLLVNVHSSLMSIPTQPVELVVAKNLEKSEVVVIQYKKEYY